MEQKKYKLRTKDKNSHSVVRMEKIDINKIRIGDVLAVGTKNGTATVYYIHIKELCDIIKLILSKRQNIKNKEEKQIINALNNLEYKEIKELLSKL